METLVRVQGWRDRRKHENCVEEFTRKRIIVQRLEVTLARTLIFLFSKVKSFLIIGHRVFWDRAVYE